VPELPEVEALRGFLAERLADRTVKTVLPVAVSVLKTYDPLPTALHGRRFAGAGRHGKFLDLAWSGDGDGDDLHLVVHLARAGWLRWQTSLPPAPPPPRRGPLALRLALAEDPSTGTGGDGFDLTEAGTRKGLAVYVVRNPHEVPGVARLGPDPLGDGFTRQAFANLLHGERRRVKGLLRDQGTIAGIGNAYSDEILHVARMSPFRLAADLTEDDADRLYEAVVGTLRDAVERSRGLAAGDLKAEKKTGMRVHGRTGLPCPVCGDTVREVSFSDSSLQYCPTCQTGGKPLADRRMSRLLK
jgi:formamidopyrimidine-DNA glycosylase